MKIDQIHIRVTEEEKRDLTKKAYDCGFNSLSAYLLFLGKNYIKGGINV